MPHEIDRYALPALVTVAGIHQMVTFAKAVGAARKKFEIKPPETTGPPEFIRTFRAHQNTLEFYPVTVTSLWIGSTFFHPVPSSILYAGYLYGRQKYFAGYVEDAEKRTGGFRISLYCMFGLVFLCVLGVGHKTVRYFSGYDLVKLAEEHCKY